MKWQKSQQQQKNTFQKRNRRYKEKTNAYLRAEKYFNQTKTTQQQKGEGARNSKVKDGAIEIT